MKLRTRLQLSFAFVTFAVVIVSIVSAIGLQQLYTEISAFLNNEVTRSRVILDQLDRRSVLTDPINSQNLSAPEGVNIDRQLVAYGEESLQKFIDYRVKIKSTVYQLALQLGATIIITLIAVTILSVGVRREIVLRIEKLTRFTKSLRSDDWRTNRRLVLTGRDELSGIAENVNRCLDMAHMVERKMIGKLNQERQLLLSVLRSYNRKACLLRLNGDLILSNQDHDFEKEVLHYFQSFLKKARTSRTMPIFEIENVGKFQVSKIGPGEDIWTSYLILEETDLLT